jgi:hypothetical protein
MRTNLLWLIILCILWMSTTSSLVAQTDTQFWFVVPETTRDHDKHPGIINVTAYENDAQVKISMPANPDFKPINLSVSAHSQRKHEFWDAVMFRSDNTVAYELMLWTIENGTMDALESEGYIFANDWLGYIPGTPFNKGLLIESDQPVGASYSVASKNNPETFNLKGGNALGHEFLIPSQNIYRNYPSAPNAREKADIVATEDSTIITIELTDNQAIEGHAAGSVFTLTLNRGQTYSLRSTSPDAQHHLGGIFITSSKPIAITISDDSIAHSNNIPAWDLVGDQLLPISNLGTKYIAMNALHNVEANEGYDYYDFNTDQIAFIWATESGGTQVNINGIPHLDVLERGDFIMVNISDNAILIETSAPVYVYQFTSIWQELGSAILPPVDCTGNQQINWISPKSEYSGNFLIQILTQKKNIPHLRMDVNHQRSSLDELNWVPVDGTGNPEDDETWYTTVKQQLYPNNQSITILFDDDQGLYDGLFHVSTVEEDRRSCTYSYYAAYNNLSIQGPTIACKGSDVTLFTNRVGMPMLWYHESIYSEPIAIDETVTVNESGTYWVETISSACISKKPFWLDISSPEMEMPANQALCPKDELKIAFRHFTNGETFEWYVNGAEYSNDSSLNLSIESDNQYEIKLRVTDKKGCATDESMTVFVKPAPVIQLHDETSSFGEAFTYVMNDTFHSYFWENLTTGSEIVPENPLEPHRITLYEPANIKLTVTNEHMCAASDSSAFTWGIPTSIENPEKNNPGRHIQIYPNPTKDESIFFSQCFSGEIYHIDGTLIDGIRQSDQLYVGDLKPGIYVFHSDCGQVIKWVKQ